MTHLEKLTQMRWELIDGIKKFFSDNHLEVIKFNEMFSCIMPVEDTFFDDCDPIYSTLIVQKMHNDGTIEGRYPAGDWMEWGFIDIDVPTLAYILDRLEAKEYTVADSTDDEDNEF